MLRLVAPLLAYLALIGTSYAQEAAPTPPDSGDTAWMMTSTVLVLLMTLPGLALFYGGLVRAKNILSVLVQCFVMAALMSVIWVAFGYSLATGSDSNAFFGDFTKLGLGHMTADSLNGTIPESVWVNSLASSDGQKTVWRTNWPSPSCTEVMYRPSARSRGRCSRDPVTSACFATATAARATPPSFTRPPSTTTALWPGAAWTWRRR